MKVANLVILCLMFSAGVAHGQLLECNSTGRCTMTAQSSSAAEVHLSANAFAQTVGDQLKRTWPSKVVDATVKIIRSGNAWQLTWSCRIVPATKDRADWKFDRRGSLQSAPTQLQVLDLIDRDVWANRKNIPPAPEWRTLNTFTACTLWSASEWCIKEYFYTAPKQSK